MNSLEERIVNELRAERELLPPANPGPMPVSSVGWPKYLGMAAALAALIVAAGWQFDRLGNGGDRLAAALEAGEILIGGDVALPVAGEIGTVESIGGTLTVIAGESAPPLAVDIDIDGSEQPLEPLPPLWDEPIWPGDVPVVYVGTVGGRSVFVHSNGTLGLFTRLKVGLGIQPAAEHVCLTVGDSTPRVNSTDPIGAAGFCAGSGRPFTFGGQFDSERGMEDGWWATWIDLPADTALVTLSIDGSGVAWQRPVGETAFFETQEQPAGPVTLTAIARSGRELASETLPVEIFPNG